MISFEYIKKVIYDSSCSFRTEILKELDGFIKVDLPVTYKIASTISQFSVKEKNQLISNDRSVFGFSELLYNLSSCNSNDNCDQLFVTGENFGFLIFADFSIDTLYGTLKFTDIRVDRKIELRGDNTLRGCWDDTLFYLGGKRII